MVKFNRFGILADVLRCIADRGADVLMALIEASGPVSSRAASGNVGSSIRTGSRHKIDVLRKGL